MSFIKYRSITLDTNTSKVNKIIDLSRKQDLYSFVVTEKVHGANICLHFIDGKFDSIYSREGGLVTEDNQVDFYNVLDLSATIKGMGILTSLYHVASMFSSREIYFYCELFGYGIHPYGYFNVDSKDFDLMLFGVVIKEKSSYRYFSITDQTFDVDIVGDLLLSKQLAEYTGWLSTNSLEDIINNFEEGVSYFGACLSEGFVLSPVSFLFTKDSVFPVIKHKNEKFKEISRKIKFDEPVSSVEAFYTEMVVDTININRLQSLLSKGYVLKSIKDVVDIMANDILLDIIEHYPETVKCKEELMKLIRKLCGKRISALLNELGISFS